MAFNKKDFAAVYDGLVAQTRQRLPQLTDFEEGSVVRSLYESFAFEMAMLYEQLDLVYNAGYVDTAVGPHLDRVVAILGIKRNEPDFAAGVVTFEREKDAAGEITIPMGTLITTEENPKEIPPKKAYLTTEEAVMKAGQMSLDVRVQAEQPGPRLTTEAETIVVMPRPVSGIKAIVNKRPVRFLGRDRETDEELRERAKKALLASGRASASSIENALLSMPGIREVRVAEGFTPDGKLTIDRKALLTYLDKVSGEDQIDLARIQDLTGVGLIDVYVDGLNDRNANTVKNRIDEVRAAGVYVRIQPAIAINVEAVLQIALQSGISTADREKIELQVAEIVTNFIDKLRMGNTLLFSQLISETLKIKGVTDLVDFRLQTYREVENFAEGSVTISRPDANKNDVIAPISRKTRLKTRLGQEFEIDDANGVAFQKGETAKPAKVRAVKTGLDGELLRTSPEVWETLTYSNINFTVRNQAPIKLVRDAYNPKDHKRIELSVFQRFVPVQVRVAATPKDLPVDAQVYAIFPALTTRQNMIGKLTAGLTALKIDQAFLQIATPGVTVDKAVTDEILAIVNRLKVNLMALSGRLAVAIPQPVADAFQVALTASFPTDLLTENNLRQKLTDALTTALKDKNTATPDAVNKGLEKTWGAFIKMEMADFPEAKLLDLLRANDNAQKLVSAWKKLLTETLSDDWKAAQLVALTENDFQLRLRLRATSFGETLTDISEAPPSFVETLTPGQFFIYSQRVELTGKLLLGMSLTASNEEKRVAKGRVRQAVEDYLDSLGPEADVEIAKIQELAVMQEGVLRVDFKTDSCAVAGLSPEGAMLGLLDKRNDGEKISVEPLEKIFLSAEDFVIEA